MAKGDNRTRTQKLRAETQEDLRSRLSGIALIKAIYDEVDTPAIDEFDLANKKWKTEVRIKLLSKVLPDLKAIELSGNQDQPLKIVAEWLK